MSELPLDHLLSTAICAAETAGRHAFENKDRRRETNEIFAHDVKLVLDVECQQIAEEVIAREFPKHGIYGEEGSRPNEAEAYEWVIDPIDGTVNYSHGVPYWCCSIAVRRHDEVVAGCVYAPETNDYYTATLADQAKLNGTPIHVSNTPSLQESMIFTGLSKLMESSSEPHFETFRALALNTKKVRINGSAALDLCRVADGTCDGCFELGLFYWDFAAAGLIARQAGAELKAYKHINDHEDYGVICSNIFLIDKLQTLYTQHI